ncbi:mechanosensitive ion channel domain-containing protein [Aurantimonas sp. Leaf443]|uniref:mechanosensitive ion channel domain-containing protein n=1 Tax=Aurantimonas sp. Leaf443 TaxID=1736378 RepID=UPI0007010FE7|nr:mechanosensitive ion channel domain-containing protein [Aurantimonas sp. Leaf443]KQT82848.1 mechanosensitive ion channel protein [Aurantimonas sp. Leaf443]
MTRYVQRLAAFVAGFLLLATLAAGAQGTGSSPASLPGAVSKPAASQGAEAEADTASLDDLIRILENDATRQKLVESLKASAYKAPEQASGEGEAAMPGEALAETLAGRIAASMQMVIDGAIETSKGIADSLMAAVDLASGAESLDLPNLLQTVAPVALVAASVFAALALASLLKRGPIARLSRRAERAGPISKLLLLALATLIDTLAVAGAALVGYVVAVAAFDARPTLNQLLFLNAFLAIESAKIVLRAFASPTRPALRMTPFSDRHARYWFFWFSRVISVLGYTFMFVAPLVQQSSSPRAADAVRFFVVTACALLAIGLILRNRGIVRERLKRAKRNGDTSLRARVHAFIGQIWWALAALFVAALYLVWLRSPEDGLAFMTLATLKTVGAMALGGLVASILARLIVRGVKVPDSVKERLPLFERRLNGFIPSALTVARVLVILAVIATTLEAWSLVSVSDWMATERGQRWVGGLIGAMIVVAIGFAVYVAISSWVEYRLNPKFGRVPTSRERTLLSLFRNAFTIAMIVVVSMLVLSQIGINIAPLLAGAGVIGLAVGFGSQKLVQDIITGAFIQIQNAMNEGDIVELNGISGTVEQLTVRSVGLRTVEGTWYLIPFSSVDRVANFSKDFAYYVADVAVAYRESIDEVKVMMREAFDELRATEVGQNIIGEFDLWGVQELANSAIIVRGRMMTKPSTQWAVGRAYREIVKRMSDERGIELPFPHMTVWFGEDKRGNAPPIHLTPPEPAAVPSPAPAPQTAPAGLPPRGPAAPGAPGAGEDFGLLDARGRLIPPSRSDLDEAEDGPDAAGRT